MRVRLGGIFLALLLTAGTVAASATTINFGSLSQPGNSWAFVGASTTQQGFTFTSSSGNLYVWQASSPNLPGTTAASTSLFEFYSGYTTTITDGGNPFTLNSIDLAPLLAGGGGTFGVTFTGTLGNSSTVSQSFTVNNSPGVLQTFTFSNFTNVVSVAYTQGANSGFYGSQGSAYQFNNVVVNNAVPEPGTLALLASGCLAALGACRRRFGI